MRVYRALYWAVMLGAALFGLYSGNRFCWLLFLTLALVLLAALGVNIWTAYSFSFVQELSSAQGEKGQAVGLHIGIYNDKPFPFTHMRVTAEAIDPAENQVLPIGLAPNTDCSFDLSLTLPRRGEFRVGMTRLELQDVFGLLPMRFDLRRLPYYRRKTVLVLPRVREFELPAGPGAQLAVSGQSASRAGQEELSQLRSWAPGDRLSRVHWAATAKTGELLSRQYEDPAGGGCLIYLDCRALSDEAADLLAECAATLLYAYLVRGEPAALGAEGHQLQRAFTLGDLTALRQWLALLPFDREESPAADLAGILAGEPYGRIYLLGGDYDAELARALETAGAPCYYWLAGPEEPVQGGAVKAAYFGGTDLPEFLYRSLMEEL